MNLTWPEIEQLETIASPGLLVDADRVAQNIQSMVEVVDGHSSRLRPHVKTHKMPEVIRQQTAAGITKFKTATIAEATMVASTGGKDVLLAYQPVGINIDRLAELISTYAGTSFAALVDDLAVAESLASRVGDVARPLRVFIDVDCGMHRTGIGWGPAMDRLRESIEEADGLSYAGLHVYDGHLHIADVDEREEQAQRVIDQVARYDQSHPSPTIVAGGSPTFGFWASKTSWECSPGTTVFWDVGYGTSHPDLPFSVAAALLTRVISKPGGNRICLDLGYKSVASEMPLEKRVTIPALADAKLIGQSEEHLVVETSSAPSIPIGQTLLAFPRHICPTVALHAHANVIRQGRATGETWPVTARDR